MMKQQYDSWQHHWLSSASASASVGVIGGVVVDIVVVLVLLMESKTKMEAGASMP